MWRFTDNYTIEVGFPRLISTEFPGMADRDLSAAFQWGRDGLVYMVRGSQYWREGSRGSRPLTDWAGLPPTIDAAVRYINGKTYFFSGQHYYRYDDANNGVSPAAEAVDQSVSQRVAAVYRIQRESVRAAAVRTFHLIL